MMEQSAEIGQLAEALAKAQLELEGAAKNSTNPHFRSKYADLGNVWEAWQEVGPKNGLAVLQFPADHPEPGMVALTTMLAHSSGQWVRETFALPCTKQDAQAYGSAVTYLRRYSLSAITGIAPVDDDGNAAAKAAPAPVEAAFVNDDQVGNIAAMIEEVGADEKKFLSYMKARTISSIPASQYQRAISALEAKRKAA